MKSTFSEHSYEWKCVTRSAAYAPRDGAGALVYKDKMWLIGGWDWDNKADFPRLCSNDVWQSIDGAHWERVKPNTFLDADFDSEADWEGRHTAGYVVFQDKIWIVGGDINQGHFHRDVWCSGDGAKWDMVCNRVPWGPRALHHTLVFNDRIWVMAGQTLPSRVPAEEYAVYNDIWTSRDGAHWEKVGTRGEIWSPRGMIGGNAVHDGRMWILGGGIYESERDKGDWQMHNDVWSSEDGVSWHRHLERAPWSPRVYHDVAVFDGKLWIVGGYAPGNLNDVWYSEDGENWRELPGSPWAPRHASSLFVYKDALWLVAGNHMEKDVWKLERRPEKEKLK